ncbi:MAG: hypothetical protein AAGJ70_12895 [Pseudomonadota bacterium]
MTLSHTREAFTPAERTGLAPVPDITSSDARADIDHVSELIRRGTLAAWGDTTSLRGRTLVMLCGADEALEAGVSQHMRDRFGMLVVRVSAGDLVSSALSHALARADVLFVNASAHDVGVLNALRLNKLGDDAVVVWHRAAHAVDVQAVTQALWFDTIGAVACSPDMLSQDCRDALGMCDNAIIAARKPTVVGDEPLDVLQMRACETESVVAVAA